MEKQVGSFVWDTAKEWANVVKHGVDFTTAAQVFRDPRAIVAKDAKHSIRERRYYCIGNVRGKILTVRFTYRTRLIRIYGAGFWRKGEKLYVEENR